jgi:NAD(P)-dependent dehydrogenase (short-subunit alcohol dehydrogenase family)
MKRMGTAEEVASLSLFLLSDESGYITGAEVTIDGGASLWPNWMRTIWAETDEARRRTFAGLRRRDHRRDHA